MSGLRHVQSSSFVKMTGDATAEGSSRRKKTKSSGKTLKPPPLDIGRVSPGPCRPIRSPQPSAPAAVAQPPPRRRFSLGSASPVGFPFPVVQAKKITVALRLRPFLAREVTEINANAFFQVSEDSKTISASDLSTDKRKVEYNFEKIFDDRDSCEASLGEKQSEVYAALGAPAVQALMEGFNSCILAYGQTGSGKTFSVSGSESFPGLVPRFCSELFDGMAAKIAAKVAQIQVGYMEIYQEQVYDLLALGKAVPLKVREHPQTGPYVEGLTQEPVSSLEALHTLLTLGLRRRATATTGMNERSSRSHAIFQLTLTQTKSEWLDGEEKQYQRCSRAHIVDLAGSERAHTAQDGAQSNGDRKERFKETLAINSSLSMLKRVMTELAKADGRFVSYRDSKLTLVLKESLGGNSCTSVLATISPSPAQRQESLSTLRFAAEAGTVLNRTRVNQDQSLTLILKLRELQAENEMLKEQQKTSGADGEEAQKNKALIELLESLLADQQKRLHVSQKRYETELAAAERRIRRLMEKSGTALRLPVDAACLVALNPDPMLSSVSLLQPRTLLGSDPDQSTLVLPDCMMEPVHCLLEKRGDSWTIAPATDVAEIFLNGAKIDAAAALQHNDRICLSEEVLFLFSDGTASDNPIQSPPIEPSLPTHDFQFAKREYLEGLVKRNKMKYGEAVAALEEELETQRQERKELEETLAETKRNESHLQDQLDVLQKKLEEHKEMGQRMETLSTMTKSFQTSLLQELQSLNERQSADVLESGQAKTVELEQAVFCANEILTGLGKSDTAFAVEKGVTGEPCVRLFQPQTGWSPRLGASDFHGRLDILRQLSNQDAAATFEKVLSVPKDSGKKGADLLSFAMRKALDRTALKENVDKSVVRKSILEGSPFRRGKRKSTLTTMFERAMADETEEATSLQSLESGDSARLLTDGSVET